MVSKNPKALPVEVGDVITHVGDEPLPQDMTDPLRLVTNLVRHKRAQVQGQPVGHTCALALDYTS